MQSDTRHPYVDLDRLNQTLPHSVIEHSMLSNSYRRAATISLNFRFFIITNIHFDHTKYFIFNEYQLILISIAINFIASHFTAIRLKT